MSKSSPEWGGAYSVAKNGELFAFPSSVAPSSAANDPWPVSASQQDSQKAEPSGVGDRVLLGWSIENSLRKVGFDFEPCKRVQDGSPIWLENDGHLITIGPTGSGKGRGALIPNLLTYEGQVIVIDPKGEACHVTARRRREMGQKVHVLDPFSVISSETDCLNPMDAFNIDGIDASSLAMDVARLLSGGSVLATDPFWDIKAHDLVAGVVSAVASICEDKDRTLIKARSLLKADGPIYNLARLIDSSGQKLGRFASEELLSFLDVEDKCRSSILATATSYLTVIGSDAAQRTVTSTTIDLEGLRRGDPMTIYLVVPPDKLASHAPLFRLWTAILMQTVLSRRGDLPEHRTLFAIDECAQIGDFETLAMIYTLARSYGLRVWTFFQDLAQLKDLLPRAWQTVLTNAAALQVFGVPNYLMGADLEKVLGDFTELELRRMDRAHLALQLAGQYGITARRPDYLKDEMFRGLYDPHPMLSRRKVS